MMPQTDHTPPMQGDEAFRRRERARRRTQWTLQIVVLAVIVGCLWLLAHNVGANLVERNIRSGFGFLSGSAGFDIGEALLPFESTDSVLKAFVNGVLNTIRVSFFAAISALILGVVVGLMRLASHPILRALGTAHVEFYRNIPLIIQLFAIYMLITELLPMSTEPLHFGSWAMLSKAGFYIAVPEQTKLALLAAVIAAVLVALLLREIWRRRVTDLVAALIGLAGGAVALIVVWCLFGLVGGWSKPQIDGFMVAQTAKSMYLSHNVGEGTAAATAFPTNIFNWAAYKSNSNNSNLEALTANPYRFIEKTAINNGQPFNGTDEDPVYRIHWAIDPTYAKGTNDGKHSTLFNTVDAAQTIDTYLNAFADKNYVQAQPGKVVYALENTFGVDRMKDNQTTRVIIKAHYQKDGEDVKDFYTDSQTDAIFTEADFMKQVKSVVFKTPAVQNWFKANLAEGSAAAEGDKNLEVTLNYNGTSDKAAGIVTVASVTPKEDGATFKADKADFPAVAEINKQILNVFKYYLGGYAYYTVMIKHFGDAQTPWNNGETFTPNATRISYPYQNAGGKANGAFDTTAEQNYLGRYGMLRNTWYNVDVTGVSAIGQPTIPTVTPGTSGDGKDDDSVEMYIHTRIRILPWAKRSQSEVLH